MRARLLVPGVLTAVGLLGGCSAPGDLFAGAGPAQPVAASDDSPAEPGRVSLAQAGSAPISATSLRVRVDAYADDLCTGLERFGASYQQARAERREGLYGTPHKAKKAMLAYVDDVDAALDKTLAATAAWGVPDVSNGERLAKKVRAALEDAQQTNYRYRPQIAALRSTDRNFTGLARTLLVESEAELSAALLKLDWFDAGSDFREAFNSSGTCKAL
ncbi:MAG: hypothetical protein ACT4QF_00955 [Sporichthyaceae bacterium]